MINIKYYNTYKYYIIILYNILFLLDTTYSIDLLIIIIIKCGDHQHSRLFDPFIIIITNVYCKEYSSREKKLK
jgi:hypothetical protein